jgi:hypothetical protein
MKKRCVAALALALTGCATGPLPFPSAEPGEVEAPFGRLGYRIGTYLTIEGRRVEAGKVGTQTLRVEKVDGHILPRPIEVWVENGDLPKGEWCIIKGYESGGWIGVPPEVLKVTGERGPQALWQFSFVFIPVPFEHSKRGGSEQTR